MSAVDERVVRMEFDNKQFEKNIKESIKSLDDLDKQLGLVDDSEAFDNIDKSSKKIDFKNMLNGLDNVSRGFTLLEGIALGALTRIGSKLVDTISRFAGMFTFQQIGAGWSKFAEYSQATQTTMAVTADTWKKEADDLARIDYLTEELGSREKAEGVLNLFNAYNEGKITMKGLRKQLGESGEKVSEFQERITNLFDDIEGVKTELTQEDYIEKAVNKLNWYSDETSYNFTDMISTMSKVIQAGGKVEESSDVVMGMMNMVAMAGGNAQIGMRAAVQFTQAMSAGAMTWKDWSSLSSMNVTSEKMKQQFIDMGVQLGTLKEQADGTYKSLNGKTKFTATKGFEDSLKDKWLTTAVMNKTLEEYGKFSNELYELIEQNDGMVDATETIQYMDQFGEAITELEETGDSTKLEKLKTDLGKVFDDPDQVDAYIEKLSELSGEEYKVGRESFIAGQAARTFTDAIEATKDAVSTKWSQIFKFIFGTSERAKEFWGTFTGTLYTLFAQPLNNIIYLFARTQKKMIETSDGFMDPFEAIRRGLENIQEAILSVVEPIREAFGDIFGEGAEDRIASFAKGFFEFTKSLVLSEEQAEQLKDVFTGVFSIIKTVSSAIGGVIKGAFNFIKPIFGLIKPIFGVIMSIGSAIGRIIKSLQSVFRINKTFKALRKVGKKTKGEVNIIGKAVEWLTDKLNKVSEWIDKTFKSTKLFAFFLKVFNRAKTIFDGIKEAFSNVWKIIKPMLPTFEDITNVFKTLWSTVKKFLPSWDDLVKGFTAVWQLIKQVGGAIWTFLKPYVEKFGEILRKFWGSLSSWFKGFVEAEDKIKYLKDTITNIINAIKEWKENSEFFKTISEAFNTIKDAISGFFDSIPEGIGGKIAAIIFLVATFLLLYKVTQIADDFTWYIGKIGKAFNKIGRAVQFVGLYLLIKAIVDLCYALQEFSKVSNPAQLYVGMGFVVLLLGVMLVIAYVIRNLVKEMTKAELSAFVGIIVSFALVLLAIAKALQIVSDINMEGFAWKVLSIVVLLAAIIGAAYLLSKFADGSKINIKALLGLVAIPTALLVAAIAFRIIGKMSPQEFQQARDVIGIFAGVILFCVLMFSIFRRGVQAVGVIATSILKVATAFLLVAVAFKIMEGIKVTASLVGTIAVIILVLAAMSVIPLVVSRLSKRLGSLHTDIGIVQKSIKAMSLGLLAITAAIFLITYAMNKFGVTSDDIVKIGLILFGIMLGMSIMVAAMGLATSIATNKGVNPNKMKQTSKLLMKIVVAVVAMAAVLALLSYLHLGATEGNTKDVLATLGILAIMLIALMLFAGLMTGIGTGFGQAKKFDSKPITAIVFAILAMAGVLVLLSKLELGVDKAWPVLITIGILLGILALTMLAMGRANDLANSWGGSFKTGPIIAAIMAILAMTFALVLLATIGDEKELQAAAWSMLTMAGAIVLIIAAMGAISYFLNKNKATGGGGAKKAIAIIGSLAVLALAIAGALWIVSKAFQNVDSVQSDSGKLWAMMGVLAILGVVFGAIAFAVGKWGKGVKSILAISVMVIALTGAIYVISMALQNVSNLEGTSGKLWAIMGILAILGLVFGGIAFILGKWGGGVASILSVSVMVVAIAAAMLVMAYAFQTVSNIKIDSGKMWALFGMIAILGVLFGVIGGVAGPGALTAAALVVGIGLAFLALAAALYVAGKALPDVSKGLAMLFSVIENSELTIGKILLFGAFAIVLTVFAGACLVMSIIAIVLAAALYIAGVGLQSLADGINALGPAMENFTLSGEKLKEFINALWNFAGVGFVFAIVAVVVAVAVIILAAALVLVAAAILIAAVAALVLAAAFLVAVVALAILTLILHALTDGLIYFAQGLYGIADIMPVVAEVGGQLASVFFKMGLGAVVLGIGLILVGAGFLLVAGALSISVNIILAASEAILLLAKSAAIISDVFTGSDMTSKIDEFTGQLKEGGAKITETLTSVKEDMAEAAGGEGGKIDIADMVNFDGGEGGGMAAIKDKFMGFLTGEGGILSNMGIAGNNAGGEFLNSFMGGLTGGGEGGEDPTAMINSIMSGKMEGVDPSSWMEKYGLSGKFSTASTESLTAGASNVDMTAVVTEAQWPEKIATAVGEADMQPAADALVTSLTSAMETKANEAKVKSSGTALGKKGAAGASSTKSDYTDAGKNGLAGLILGLKDSTKLQEIYDAGVAAGKKFMEGFGSTGAMDFRSPSHAMMARGKLALEGFVIGVRDNVDLAEDAGVEIANKTLSALGTATEILADTILNDYTNPVIRPTLDLSNVAEGASTISSMFGRQSVGVDGDIDGTSGRSRSGNTINYVQNNYSPKALNRMEIYRQTKNQINLSQQNVLAKV